MSNRSDPSAWLPRRTGLTLLTVISVVLAGLIVFPYLQYIVLGIILAYILMPLQQRLERIVRPMVAALALVIVAVLAILLPTLYVLVVALEQALSLVTDVQNGSLETDDVERMIAETGYEVDIEELYVTYQEPIASGIQRLASGALEFLGAIPSLLIGLTVTLFVLFALLRDGEQLVAWIRYVVPVEDDIQRELLAELDQLMWASVVGNVAVAAIQAVMLGVGLMALGLPAVVFLTVATFVLALLPLVGAFGVWVPVSIYLLAVGEPLTALILVVYGSIVSVSDTYLRPALIGRTSAFNSAIVVVGIFGGLVAFGAVGLFVGPVVLGGAKVVLDVYAREGPGSTRPVPGEPEPAVDPAVDTEPGTGPGTDLDPDAVAEDESGPAERSDASDDGSDDDRST